MNNQEQISNSNSISPYFRLNERLPIHRIAPKIQRNTICKFENKKFKNCCGKKGINFCERIINNFIKSEENQ